MRSRHDEQVTWPHDRRTSSWLSQQIKHSVMFVEEGVAKNELFGLTNREVTIDYI